MSDLISRQTAIAYAISGLTREIDGENWIRVSEVRESIKALPSAQSEIIRCKDCKHKNICFSEVAMTNKYQTTTLYERIEWCSKGERKES